MISRADLQAVARGDLSETIEVEASGEIAELKTTVNGMVSCLVSDSGSKLTSPGDVTTYARR